MNTKMFVFISLSIFGVPAANSQTVPFDNSYSGDGKTLCTVGATFDYGNCGILQDDDKMIVAGSAMVGSNHDFALVRFNIDGSLDNTFGTGGKVITAISPIDDIIYDMVLQPDGKIVVAGSSSDIQIGDFVVARYLSDGTLDLSFGTNGFTVTTFGISDEHIQSVALQSDGKIVVGGYCLITGYPDYALARYNSDGSPDLSFDVDGKMILEVSTSYDYCQSIAIQDDGKILAGGYSHDFTTNYDFSLVRLNTDGSLDLTFSSDGIVTTNIGPNADWVEKLLLQDDGKIVLVGYHVSTTFSTDAALVRYNSDGTLDNTFGAGGIVTSDYSGFDDHPNSACLQTDGKILVTGYTQTGNFDIHLARYDANGNLDATFDTDGFLVKHIGNNNDYAFGIDVQTDGRIVIAGFAENGPSGTDIFAARFIIANAAITESKFLPNVSIYPNPATNQLFVNGENPGVIYRIFSMSGTLIETQSLDGTIDISNLDCGVYYITLTSSDGVVEKHKVIKN